MDDSNELEKKLGRYFAMPDWPSTWAKIYKDGGMELIREYCKRLEPVGKELRTYEHKIVTRYWIGAGQAAESEAEILKIIDGTPVRYRPEILKNPCCTELIIEMLWVGDYAHNDGKPYPEIAAAVAFFNHYYKALAVFVRRPDLRDLPEYMLNLFLAGLVSEGMSIDKDLSKNSADEFSRLN